MREEKYWPPHPGFGLYMKIREVEISAVMGDFFALGGCQRSPFGSGGACGAPTQLREPPKCLNRSDSCQPALEPK